MMPLEEMRAFFAKRVDDYDAHMLTNIEGIREAYAQTARLLPEGMRTLLDLGCGTGLELTAVFERFPEAHVWGVDLTQAMLDALARKFRGRALELICGDYFRVDFGEARFDAALSFQTLHHFTHAEKIGLYRRVEAALRPGGVYVEADYTADGQREEDAYFQQKAALLAEQGDREGLFHFDTPCTVENQLRLLTEAGFARAAFVQKWGNTAIFTAQKQGMCGGV